MNTVKEVLKLSWYQSYSLILLFLLKFFVIYHRSSTIRFNGANWESVWSDKHKNSHTDHTLEAPRAWNSRFSTYLTRLGFVSSKCDPSLFVYKKRQDIAYLLLYVDDIVLTGSSAKLLHRITTSLKSEFPMGRLSYFLGIKVDYNDSGVLLTQQHYAMEIIERAGMKDCKPLSTPVDVNSKLSLEDGGLLKNPTEYRKLAGALQYHWQDQISHMRFNKFVYSCMLQDKATTMR